MIATLDPSILTLDELAPMLHAWADGDHATEAAVGLLIAQRSWLIRPRFRSRCVDAVADGWTRHGVVRVAAVDWTTAAEYARQAWATPTERAMLLIACSLAGHGTVSVGELTEGLGSENTTLVLQAIAHRGGWQQRRIAALVTGTLDHHRPGTGATAGSTAGAVYALYQLPGFGELRATAYGLLGDAVDWLRSDWQPGHGPTRDAAGHVAKAMAAILRAKHSLNAAADAMTQAGETGSATDAQRGGDPMTGRTRGAAGDELAEELRAWARGLYPCEAAVEVLIRSGMHRRLTGYPDVIGRPPEYRWVDWEALAECADNGPWSGGERRLLLAAAALSEEVPVRLDIAGLDQANVALVLHGLAHSAGWHEQGAAARIDGTFTDEPDGSAR